MLTLLPVTIEKVPGSTNVTPLFASATYASQFMIVPRPANNASASVLFDWLAIPLNSTGFTWGPCPSGQWYDLSRINVKAGNTTDGVLVTYDPAIK